MNKINFRKHVVSTFASGVLLCAALPASAQLLGGGISGAVGGALDAQFGAPGSPGLGGLHDRLGEGAGSLRTRTAEVKEGVVAGAREAGRKTAAAGAEGREAAANTSREADGNVSLQRATAASLEREAAGRKVSASGSSNQGITGDATGLSLSSANAADAAITRAEPAATTTAE